MRYIIPFSEIGINDVPQVGGKNASLGEMYRTLSSSGIKVPNGFATTADAYRYFIDQNHLRDRIAKCLQDMDQHDIKSLTSTGKQIRSWILHAEIPPDLEEAIADGYRKLEQEYGESADVAVRSSATAEDLAHASFAGQQETYLNISGRRNLLLTCKRVFASLFTDRAISYRQHQGFEHMDVALSVGVQKMVRADSGASGVMFTLDTESGFRDVVFINASYGLGENIVQGAVNPDEFYVFKPTLMTGYRPILRRHLGEKAIKMVYARDTTAGLSTHNVRVMESERKQFCLNDDEVLQLARYAVAIEQHYDRPMDIEWAKDGNSGELFILQARPETVQSQKSVLQQEMFRLQKKGEVLVKGKSVGKRIASGKACVMLDAADMHKLQPGDVLVTDITDPDWEPVMKKASAIVTNRGGRTCHAAIIAREMGIPAVVGCGDATSLIQTGQSVTVSCAEGDDGFVYAGELPYRVETLDVSNMQKPQTRIMLNLANPETAFEASQLPVDGVGLARIEFIINNSIRVHPRALMDFAKLDVVLQKKINDIISGYSDARIFYVNKLAEG
ncbi:MAG: pyruvate, water dikinase, partial [Pseudomonadota bacterium]|nr:pyruvate, water dikinase [Pseudomonadota bacterium]